MRKCLTKCSRIFRIGAMQKSPKRRISVNLVDLIKSFHASISLQKAASSYSRERASQSLPNISQKLEKKLEHTWARELERAPPDVQGGGQRRIREHRVPRVPGARRREARSLINDGTVYTYV